MVNAEAEADAEEGWHIYIIRESINDRVGNEEEDYLQAIQFLSILPVILSLLL